MITRPGDAGWTRRNGLWIPPAPKSLPPGSYIEMPCAYCGSKGVVRFWWFFWHRRCRWCEGTGTQLFGPNQR
jgi:hypothetical protein